MFWAVGRLCQGTDFGSCTLWKLHIREVANWEVAAWFR